MQILSIIGCGNPNRSDDGVGVYVIQKLLEYYSEHPKPGVRIFDSGTAGMDVMFQARGSDALVIVDANCSESEPGSIFKVPGEELENIPEPSFNLHDFRWDNALFAGRKIFKDEFPEDVTVYLIESEDLSLGIGLTPRILAAAEKVYSGLVERIEAHPT